MHRSVSGSLGSGCHNVTYRPLTADLGALTTMPNQYTKFQAASEDPTTRAFTWREWSGKKQKRGRRTNKRDIRASNGGKGDPIDGSATSGHDTDIHLSSGSASPVSIPTSTSTSPSNSLLQYSPSGGLRMDPFRSYPVTPDNAEMAVLDHCTVSPSLLQGSAY